VKENFDHGDAVVGLRFDVLDVVHGRGHRPLANGHETLLHFLWRYARVTPDHAHDWNIDRGKNIRRQPQDGNDSDEHDQDCHDREGIGATERQADNPHS